MRRVTLFTLAAVAVGIAACTEQSNPLSADDGSNAVLAEQRGQTAYDVALFSSPDGTSSAGNAINNRGWVAGYDDLPGNVRHAALGRHGSVIDLGTLGGTHSAVAWPGLNERGVVVGIAETDVLNPLGETWSCAAFFPSATGLVCRGFAWAGSAMEPMPTLGGYNSFATGVNSRGWVVGWAETDVQDPTCDPNSTQVLQFRAVVWDPRSGRIEELPPLPGDSTSAATAINDRGEVVGISGACDQAVGRFSAMHAVIWRNGRPTDIGNLGGGSWHTPMALNERGVVVGFSNPPTDNDSSFVARAFLWTQGGGIRDLGTLPGGSTSQALGINAQGRVVGLSDGPEGTRAVIWQDGAITDLNDLVPGYTGPPLLYAGDINDEGEITGAALVDPDTGETVAFVATPTR